MIWEAYPNVTYCTLTRQSLGNWGRHAKQHAFLYQLWTTGTLLNILFGPPNHNSQISPMRLMSLDHEPKMRWCAMSWTMGFDVFLCKYGLFCSLKEVFPKSMIMLTWCGSPMKWSHVVWKICPQQTYHRKIGCKYKIVEKKIFLRRHFPILIIETLKVISTRYNNTNDNSV